MKWGKEQADSSLTCKNEQMIILAPCYENSHLLISADQAVCLKGWVGYRHCNHKEKERSVPSQEYHILWFIWSESKLMKQGRTKYICALFFFTRTAANITTNTVSTYTSFHLLTRRNLYTKDPQHFQHLVKFYILLCAFQLLNKYIKESNLKMMALLGFRAVT